MNNKKRAACAVLLCAAGIGIAGLQCGLTVRQYTIQSNKVPAGKSLRLVMLSDLHSYIYGYDQSSLLQKAADAQPDMILLCGDIVDDKRPLTGATLFLSGVAELAPCYYVSGNHEYWSGDPQGIFSLIESYSIRVLRNEWEEIETAGVRCTIYGVDDPARYGDRQPRSYGDAQSYQHALAAFDNIDRSRLNILLAHRPEYIAEYAQHPFDLTLCGHAHGGQWRIPYLLNGLFAPNQGFFPAYAGGRYSCNGMTEIVSRGLVRNWKPRFFNPPEIVVVDLIHVKN